MRRHGAAGWIAACVCIVWTSAAAAHSASDADVNLWTEVDTGARGAHLQGQWDIALRDLNFVLGIDDDGDGRVTWGEVRRHLDAIERYAFANLHVRTAHGKPCRIDPGRRLIDEHADGAYVVLLFDVACSAPAASLALDYRLFFTIDPSHRGIFTYRNGADLATAVLSPERAVIALQPSGSR
jgi:hypothetical protein